MGRDRRAETIAAKKALKEAGYTGIRVAHGRGTAWGWLDVTVDRRDGGIGPHKWHEEYDRILGIVAEATGRTDGYDRERINVTQRRTDVAPIDVGMKFRNIHTGEEREVRDIDRHVGAGGGVVIWDDGVRVCFENVRSHWREVEAG